MFRRWALANPQLFTTSSAQPTPLLELGSGVGLLGISLSVGLGVDVLLSDFDGHHVGTLVEPEDSVLALLEHNARANAEVAAAQGGSLAVIALDWAAPAAPRRVYDSSEQQDGAAMAVTQAAVIVGTELVCECSSSLCVFLRDDETQRRCCTDTVGAAALLCETLSVWLRKPDGVFYLLQAQNRVDMDRFGHLAEERGLALEELQLGEAVSACGEVAGAAAGHFRLVAVRWRGPAVDCL